MPTQCNAAYLEFPRLGRREALADFGDGAITSDGGALLLREVERLTGIIRQFAGCLEDHRDPDRIEHTVEELPEPPREKVSSGLHLDPRPSSLGPIPSVSATY